MKKRSFNWHATKQRFSLRKYHFGVASVLLGSMTLGAVHMGMYTSYATTLQADKQLSASYTGYHEERNGRSNPKRLGVVFDVESSLLYSTDSESMRRGAGKTTVINLWSGVPLGNDLEFTANIDTQHVKLTGNRQAKQSATGNRDYMQDNATRKDFQSAEIATLGNKRYKLANIVQSRPGAQINYIQTRADIGSGAQALSFRPIELRVYNPLPEQSVINKQYGQTVTKQEILNAVMVHSGKVFNLNDNRQKQQKVSEHLLDDIEMSIPDGFVLPDWGMNNKVPVTLTFKHSLATTDEGKTVTMNVTINFTNSPNTRPTQADKFDINDPEKTAVVNPNQLTPAEKTGVANKIKKQIQHCQAMQQSLSIMMAQQQLHMLMGHKIHYHQVKQ